MTSDRELGDRLRRAFEAEVPPSITPAQIRERAERQLADVADLVLFLVGTALSGIALSSVMYDTMMAWVTEAVEHAGEAVPISELKRQVELAHQDTQLRADLDHAMLTVAEAARQLAATSPDDRAGQGAARRALGQAISRLLDVSTRLMRLDAVRASGTEPVEIPRRAYRTPFARRVNEILQAQAATSADYAATEARSAVDVTRAALYGPPSLDDNRYLTNAEAVPRPTIDQTLQTLDALIDTVEQELDIPVSQGGVAPTSPF